MRWCHVAYWLGAAGGSLQASSACVFSVITHVFKTEPTPLAVVRNCWQIVWNGFISYHLRKLLLPWTKKQPFFGFVLWRTRHRVCSVQLPDGGLPTLFQGCYVFSAPKLVKRCQMPLYANLHIKVAAFFTKNVLSPEKEISVKEELWSTSMDLSSK